MPDASSHAGRLAVATPDLGDPNFSHTVVLLLEHGDDGALGIVLNRPSDVAVAEALPGWEALAASPPVVFVGGPVESSAIVALGVGAPPAPDDSWTTIVGDLRAVDLTADPDESEGIETIRVFAGYAGWAPGQLDDEVEAGGWFVIDAEASDVLTDEPDLLWRRVLVRQGGVFTTAADDPSLN